MADEKPIIVVKKKGHHGGHHGGAWKVAYADFVTAMMAFFMVMWLVGTADNPTKQAVAAYFRKPGIFETGTGKPLQVGGAGIFNEEVAPSKDPGIESGNAKTLSGEESPDDQSTDSKQDRQAASKVLLPVEVDEGQKPGIDEGLGGEAERFKKFAGQLREALALTPEIKNVLGDVDITLEPDGIRIEILDTETTSMFSSGSAQISQEAQGAFSKIAQFIKQVPYPIDVIGHTDSKQLSSRFNAYTNWELSADRANAARRFLERQGVAPARIRGVIGQADRTPKLPDNTTAAANRRIEIKLRLPPPTPEEKIDPPPGPAGSSSEAAAQSSSAGTSSLFPDAPVLGPRSLFDFPE